MGGTHADKHDELDLLDPSVEHQEDDTLVDSQKADI